MLFFDQLKREDRSLQTISFGILAGMIILLVGLWRVQVVSADKYQSNMEKQTFRSVRVPGIRGKILDRNGIALVENRPRYSLDLYLEELLAPFTATNNVKAYKRAHPEIKQITQPVLDEFRRASRTLCYQIVSNATVQTSSTLLTPVAPREDAFFKHLSNYTYVPFPILTDLNEKQLAIYYEQLAREPAIDIDVQPVRTNRYGSTAAHILGYVTRQKAPREEEEISYQYCLPYWKGKAGLEAAFEEELCGRPGVKWVLVNKNSYRQREEMKASPGPGRDLWLTIDARIQRAAERALGANTRGAAVVMDVRNGDILALVSSPAYDPNMFVRGVREDDPEYQRLQDKDLLAQFNRATGAYHPGSIFKIITSIACLESGLDPDEMYESEGYYQASPRSRPIHDTAGAGDFDFERAFYKSSNPYFISYGKKAGSRRLLDVGKRFHFGESTELGIGPESMGFFPRPEEAGSVAFPETSLQFACIGQIITVTPVQVACMLSAIANGGSLWWPRIVSHLRNPDTGEIEMINSPGRLRSKVALNPRHLELIRHAMVLDTESSEGTAHKAFFNRATGAPISPLLANFRVCGKTGTAQRELDEKKDHVTWFASFGPYENPRYAVVVMVEGDLSTYGVTYCAPGAEKIYEALVQAEQRPAAPEPVLAGN